MLLVSHDHDAHALAVALELARLGAEPVLVDLARLPQSGLAIRLGGGRRARFVLGSARGHVDPSASVAVWWRRPRRPEPPGPGR